ncbi:MAG: outer membrane protein transport protein [Breznakibacter sp.]
MKRHIIFALLMLCGTVAMAQSEAEVLLTSRSLPTGSARSLSLGNAMGAIGGDLTAIGINPAGIAVYRTSEFSLSSGLQINSTDASYWGQTTNDTKTNIPLNQIGFVSTFMPMRQSKGIVSSHFSFSYNRVNNFNQNVWLQGDNVSSSMLDMWVINANGYTPEALNTPGNPNYFGANLAYGAYLIDETSAGSSQYIHAFEGYDGSGAIIWRPQNGIRQKQLIDRNGYGGEYSFAGGINIDNKLLLGASLNFQNIRAEQSSMYQERDAFGLSPAYDDDIDYFNYYETWNRYGTSINFKIGAIVKPTNNIRIGFAFHSPNYFEMREEYDSSIKAYYKDGYNESVIPEYPGEFEYKIITPMKLVGSLGFIIGERGFVSADYEYQDYSKAKFKLSGNDWEYSDYIWSMNQNIKTVFDKTHSFRVGGEYRATDNIALRGGYGFYGSPYKEEYLSEKMKLQTYSLGLGYRAQSFYLDLAYMLVAQNEDYYPYSWNTGDAEFDALAQPAKIESNTSNIVLTLGWKF